MALNEMVETCDKAGQENCTRGGVIWVLTNTHRCTRCMLTGMPVAPAAAFHECEPSCQAAVSVGTDTLACQSLSVPVLSTIIIAKPLHIGLMPELGQSLSVFRFCWADEEHQLPSVSECLPTLHHKSTSRCRVVTTTVFLCVG